jgi:nucleotide-binding universal stress UspA family protein
MKRILIATDGSAPAHEALEFGLDLAAEQDAETFVVHVAPIVDPMPYGGFGYFAPALLHEFDEHDRGLLTEAAEFAAEKRVDVKTKLLQGNPADEIVTFADSIDADLVVVGSRGHGAFASALLGSVSGAVLHQSRRPVLIVRGTQVTAAAGVPA